MAKPVVKKEYTLGERIYLWEILKGLRLTWRHFVFNVRASFRPGPHTIPTCWQYPEDRTREISPVFRGEHMLQRDDKGREKCIACGMCAKICPAKCITIKKGKREEGEEDKYAAKTYPASFEVDLLRCIFCGFCQEVCPKQAIVLGQNFELARYTREECILDKRRLLANYRKAKEEGRLRPPRKPVPVVPAPPKPEKDKKAEGAEAKKGKAAVAGKAKKKPIAKKKAAEKPEGAEKAE
ncbi:MAG: NADH-quinone oxidoreductase subunit I [Deltaproteobacteria bacterium]|nr:NADH-quinone oxidoreductase subunit I [Deltaproteobacteria bacterium]